jgi:hypothetical protein
VLRYTREIAFGAAQVYARTAEARGAWDARLEALVVDSLVRGEVDEGSAVLGLGAELVAPPVSVGIGRQGRRQRAGGGHRRARIEDIARRARLDLLAGVHGNRLILVVGGTDDPIAAAERFAGRFGPGPVVVGPLVRDLQSASVSPGGAGRPARRPAWPDAPRPVGADDLLPERALDGDDDARRP